MAVAQFDLSHVDRTPMMRDHHRDEISVYIVGWLYRHVRHHLGHCNIALSNE